MKTEFLSEMHVMKSHFCILVTASLRRGREEERRRGLVLFFAFFVMFCNCNTYKRDIRKYNRILKEVGCYDSTYYTANQYILKDSNLLPILDKMSDKLKIRNGLNNFVELKITTLMNKDFLIFLYQNEVSIAENFYKELSTGLAKIKGVYKYKDIYYLITVSYGFDSSYEIKKINPYFELKMNGENIDTIRLKDYSFFAKKGVYMPPYVFYYINGYYKDSNNYIKYREKFSGLDTLKYRSH
jgi:hypothetical protein